MTFLRSPLAYQGSKFKLLNELAPILNQFDTVHDVFGGSGTVALNLNVKKIYYNEYDTKIVDILKSIIEVDCNKAIRRYNKTKAKYNLSSSNKESYLAFRDIANRKQNPFLFWVLSKHSFCSLLRFNSKGNMNYGFGKRSMSLDIGDKEFTEIHKRLSALKMHNLPYLTYMKKFHLNVKPNTVFYFDPPYLASGDNVYLGKWREDDETKFLSMLDYLDRLNIKWVLSNVLSHRGHSNPILRKWCKKYKTSYPSFNTSGEAYILNRATTDSDINQTIEVLIKNF